MELTGARCVLRPWLVSDEVALAQIADSRRIWRNLADAFPHPYTLTDARAFLEARSKDEGACCHLAIVVEEHLAGCVGLTLGRDVHSHTAEFGYWLGEAYWGRGVATEAVRLFLPYAFTSFPVDRIQALVKAWNPASARVLEKNGFSLEARLREHVFKDGEFVDQLIYGLLRKELS